MSENVFYSIVGLGLLGVLLIVLAGITTLALYVLNSYSLYTILKAVGYEMAWLAWIPFCEYFAITMAFNYKDEPNISIFGISIPRQIAGFARLIITVINVVLPNSIPFVAQILAILAILINGNILCEMFDVCEDSEPGKNLGISIISALIPLVQIVMFFKYMGKAGRGEINIGAYSANH